MINFIVCEDNKIILQKNIDLINKFMFNNNINYKVYSFFEYSDELQSIIDSNIENKIYILDIELENASGIDIAKQIRRTDSQSIIIISTIYIEYLPYTLKTKLMLFDFVSKFENYEQNLCRVVNNAISYIKEQNKLLPTNESKKQIEEGVKKI